MFNSNAADLEWLAFQYVSDELSAAEAARFEERLANDQAAREAVAEAVLLVQAVAAGEKLVSPAIRQRSWLQAASWAALGAAVCLALVIALRSPREAKPVAVQQSPRPDMTSAELALVWAQSSDLADVALSESPADDELSMVLEARELDREVIVPVWMLEALSGSQETRPASPQSQES